MCGGGVGCCLGCEVSFVFLEGSGRVWGGCVGVKGKGEDEDVIDRISIHTLYRQTERARSMN
jgi:hypothetical protein